jgi:hypothetical protein
MLREMFAPRGWEVVNQSRGGDTTITMAPRFAPQGAPDPKVRYLLPANPGYVVIGLSLANEGIFEAKTKQEKDAVFKQYADGIKGFVDRSREHNIVPVVALVYPRMVYTPVEYVRPAHEPAASSWDAPTVSFLGASTMERQMRPGSTSTTNIPTRRVTASSSTHSSRRCSRRSIKASRTRRNPSLRPSRAFQAERRR